MLSLNDIINVSFRKSGFSGYRAEDVDVFIDKVRESYDELLKKGLEKDEQIDRLNTEGRQTADKLKILADKIEEYRSQEDEIKNALISAQKLGDASVREARHKAEIIVKDANQKAERLIASADEKIAEQKRELERLQRTVSDFRSKLLNTYKEHLTLIDALPAAKPQALPEEQPAAAPQEPEAAMPQEPEAEEPSSPFRADISNFEDETFQNE
jgi:cell division initiation protein